MIIAGTWPKIKRMRKRTKWLVLISFLTIWTLSHQLTSLFSSHNGLLKWLDSELVIAQNSTSSLVNGTIMAKTMIIVSQQTTTTKTTLNETSSANNTKTQGGYGMSDKTSTPTAKTTIPVIGEHDFIYKKISGSWDSAPIVVEEYKLLFFTIPKVACTTFKMLFRRMSGIQDWKSQDPKTLQPHNPKRNGLKYLWDYSLEDANHMMTDPSWTRAIFLRDPKERFLSAYLDKAVGNFNHFIRSKCCPITTQGENGSFQSASSASSKADCAVAARTITGFLSLIQTCSDPHWAPQYDRMAQHQWIYINFIGSIDTIQYDGRQLLQRIGAWEQYGQSGWGPNGAESIFANVNGQPHATFSKGRHGEYFTPTIERQVEQYYEKDYQFALFQFVRTNLTNDHQGAVEQ